MAAGPSTCPPRYTAPCVTPTANRKGRCLGQAASGLAGVPGSAERPVMVRSSAGTGRVSTARRLGLRASGPLCPGGRRPRAGVSTRRSWLLFQLRIARGRIRADGGEGAVAARAIVVGRGDKLPGTDARRYAFDNRCRLLQHLIVGGCRADQDLLRSEEVQFQARRCRPVDLAVREGVQGQLEALTRPAVGVLLGPHI